MEPGKAGTVWTGVLDPSLSKHPVLEDLARKVCEKDCKESILVLQMLVVLQYSNYELCWKTLNFSTRETQQPLMSWKYQTNRHDHCPRFPAKNRQ